MAPPTSRSPRVSPGALIGGGLAVVSAALYFVLAAYWTVASITDDPVAEPGSISLHGSLGAFLSALAFIGGGTALLTAWLGVRLWVSSKPLAVIALASGATLGVLPALMLMSGSSA